MKFHTHRRHMIDFIFPVSLFFIFALCALAVLLFAARIYQSITEHSSRNYTAGTALSYISEKIHQNDTDGNIQITELDGETALRMEHIYDNATYFTYIYSDDQELKELFIKEGVVADPSAGTKILDIQDFSMKKINSKLFRFDCTDRNNQKDTVLVSVKSN